MVLASHHVIQEIIDVVDDNDMKKLREFCTKFCKRYPKDDSLQNIICGESSLVEEYILSREDAVLEKLKSGLHKLWNVRQLESSGGERLWFKGRRG